GPGDASNALLLAGLQRANLVDNGTSTLDGAYAGLVSDVGNEAQQVQVASASQASLAGQVRAQQQSVSGVNQDEEAANLMQYQQMYQANAKVIQAASTMFNTILGLQPNG
ncbi:MAG TPA: flagellar basal body rod C-terminal domain-containing protein, partial [Ramlibacter sp.]|nr:flagellar basal body rod C-terminal domain-containing protein [Ramlibacter sp.]